jgi:regulator of protease activity HflC (stomatin/prohibitin superfamily)
MRRGQNRSYHVKERAALSISGWGILAFDIALFSLAARAFVQAFTGPTISEPLIVIGVILALVAGIVASGFTQVEPNIARVIIFIGRYAGTVRRTGFTWTVPLTMKPTYSLRLRNFESETLKVNDAIGNPIEVAAVIVWRVVDTAQAAFDVDDYEGFVKIQTETAIRHMASEYPYDVYTEGQVSLRANADEVMGMLLRELQEHMTPIGVEVLKVQLRRLAYAPEIAADMLRRQQAEAVVAARRRIVEGAVGMVEQALERLSEKQIVTLDEERKAAMVSNLLVVLCSEHHAQPVVNAGTLYQ